MDSIPVEEQIAQLEQQRCEALLKADIAALERLVDDDIVHVHTSGRCDDKASYLEGVASRFTFLSVARESLHVRPLGDTAIATGILVQTLRINATGAQLPLRAFVTQVWSRASGSWRQCVFQATIIK